MKTCNEAVEDDDISTRREAVHGVRRRALNIIKQLGISSWSDNYVDNLVIKVAERRGGCVECSRH
jgi:hypothetical protein